MITLRIEIGLSPALERLLMSLQPMLGPIAEDPHPSVNEDSLEGPPPRVQYPFPGPILASEPVPEAVPDPVPVPDGVMKKRGRPRKDAALDSVPPTPAPPAVEESVTPTPSVKVTRDQIWSAFEELLSSKGPNAVEDLLVKLLPEGSSIRISAIPEELYGRALQALQEVSGC